MVIACVAALSAAADATTAMLLTRDELVARSHVVARVTVGKSVTTESDDGASIVTRTELSVQQTIKGKAPKTVTVEQIGGTLKGKTQRVIGDGKLVQGEDEVVFLRVDEKGMAYLTALALSVYHVDEKGMARRDLDGVSLVRRVDGRLQPVPAPAEAPETVEHLMTDVSRIGGSK